MRRLARIAGTILIAAGVGCLAWAALVWQWQDPFTAATHALDQRRLEDDFQRRLEAADPRRGGSQAHERPVTLTGEQLRRSLAAAAADWRAASRQGEAVARLRLPTLGVDEIVVNGTDSATLKRGPGRYLGSAMPGEGELVYVAGHRTTYGAPFARIDRLRPGAPVVVELPYGVFRYRVVRHRIVRDDELSVLESRGVEELALQACHPRFFASHRYIAYAELVSVTPPGGTPQELTAAAGAG